MANTPDLGNTLRLFIDTEFTSFIDCDLISIGLATTGHTFYGENREYNQGWASTWVKTNVLPFLEGGDVAMRFNELSARVWCWLDELPCTSVIIVADYGTDYELLFDLFGNETHPKVVAVENLYTTMNDFGHVLAGEGTDGYQYSEGCTNAERIKSDYTNEFLDWFRRWGKAQHHAGNDAVAIRDAYTTVANKYGLPI